MKIYDSNSKNIDWATIYVGILFVGGTILSLQSRPLGGLILLIAFLNHLIFSYISNKFKEVKNE